MLRGMWQSGTVPSRMVSSSRTALRRVVPASGFALVAVVVVAAWAYAVARTVFLEQARERLRMAVLGAGGHVAARLDQTLDALRRMTDEMARLGHLDEGLMERTAGLLPRSVRGVVAVDRFGAVVTAAPRGAVLDLPREVVAALVREISSSAGAAWAQTTERMTGLDVLLVGVPVGTEPRGEAGASVAVLAVVDLRQLERALGVDPTVAGNGLLLVMRGAGQVVVASERPSGVGLEEILPEAALAAARQQLARGQTPRGVLVGVWNGRRQGLLVAAEQLEELPGQWAVAGLLPVRVALEPARGLFLVGGLGLVVLAALWVAFAVSCARSEVAREEAVAEAERLRRASLRSDLEARCRFLLDHAGMPLVLLRDLEVVALNHHAEAFLGVESGRLGKDVRLVDLVEESGREAVLQLLGESHPQDHPREWLRTALRTAGGEHRAVEVTVSHVGSDPEGGQLQLVALRELASFERCSALLDAVGALDPRAVLVLDREGRLVWGNGTLFEKTGLKAAKLQERGVLALIAPGDRKRARAIFASALRGNPRSTVVRTALSGGASAVATLHAVPLDVAGVRVGVVVSAEEAKAATLAASVPEARLATALADFGAAVAHRLNNDLQALVGLVNRIHQEGTVTPYFQETSQLLAAATAETQKLVAVGRIGSSGLRELRLGGLVERWCQRKRAALPPSVRLFLRRDVEEDRIVGDALQLQLVLDVAVDAAVGELERGGGAVEVSVEGQPGASTVRLTVADTGEAVPVPEGQEPGAWAVSREAALALAQAVAYRHQGRCGSRQRAGIGNRLWLELPLSGQRRRASEPKGAPAGRGVILLADDEELVRQTLAEALRVQGYEVVEAWDGAMVLELVEQQGARFDLVVLDLLMPKLSGREAYQRLRQFAPSLPVLVCTGYEPASEDDLSGAEVIIKPFSLEEFVARVGEILGVAGGGAPADGKISQ
jgi:PAS domain S-box-containing protein